MTAKKRWEYIYGLNPAFEVLRGGRREVLGAFINEGSAESPRMKKLAGLLERNGVPIERVDKNRVFQLAGTKDHQGVVLKVRPYPYVAFEELLTADRLLLLDNVEDPHNAGAIIRCADCFGFGAILLPLKGTPDIYPSVVKVSAGATEHLSIAREMNANRYCRRVREAGYKIAALDAGGTAALEEFDPGGDRWLLVIGGEAKSVGQYILNEADAVLRIDMHGRINSLNASVAAGIAMHAFRATM